MNVYCSNCKLGDCKGSQCLVCKRAFQYRCVYCGTYLTDAGRCPCIRPCKKCNKEHSSRKTCDFFIYKDFGERDVNVWYGSLKIGMGYPPILKSLSGPPIQYSTFPFMVSRETPIAKCSFHFRYHDNRGQGALKYDPVMCSRIYDENSCMRLRELRGWGNLSFQFHLAIAPGCSKFERKIMVVPSIGCPKALGDESVAKLFLWAKEAKKRPVVLLVHESEVEDYVNIVGKVLAELDVGIVAWRCDSPVVGFGISRLAAQQCRCLFPGSGFDVILCDVNVVASSEIPKPKRKPKEISLKTVETGYASDDEDYVGWKRCTTLVYMSSGKGTGVPTLERDSETGTLQKNYKKGGDGRPIEQVVVVGDDELLYDPCFITSSEDADMTAGVEYALSFMPSKDSKNLTRKSDARIDKMDISKFGNHSKAYIELRNIYLKSLRHEDAIVVEYYKDETTTNVTVGDLARSFAELHKLDPLVIRSLIIEKILLEYKMQYLYK